MADLTVSANPVLGPLSVEVIAVGGEREQHPVQLSSVKTETTFGNLQPGAYAVIGTRPNGETIVERVTLDQQAKTVDFKVKGDSPHEFLTEAMWRGLVPSVPFHGASVKEIHRQAVSGAAGRALDALAAERLRKGRSLSSEAIRTIEVGGSATTSDGSRRYVLRQWGLATNRWLPAYAIQPRHSGPDYLQIEILNGGPIRAFGLLNEDGFGPIVVAPPFGGGLRITFLADGLTAEDAAERVDNPSAVRVPVAVAVPKDDHSADLLSGLVAGSLPGADQLLVQADQARAKLEAKFGDAAAAVLGAHFLSRFSPDRAPVPWLENLGRLLPAVADGPTLLAWRLIADGSADGRKVSRSDIQQILSDAARRPCTLFARTRALLTQALRLYGPEQPEPSSSDSPRPFLPGDFLNVAADAGGVEAFWGASPDWPGRSSHPLDQRPQEPVVRFDRGSFR